MGDGLDPRTHRFDPLLDVSEVIQKVVQQVPHGLGQIIFQIALVPADIEMEGASADPHRETIFQAEGPRLVHQPGALTDKSVADSVERQQVNLLRGSRFDKSHGRSCNGLGYRSGIDRVGLVRLHIGLHKSRRNDPGIMPYSDQLSGQPLRSGTGFHADQRFGHPVEE